MATQKPMKNIHSEEQAIPVKEDSHLFDCGDFNSDDGITLAAYLRQWLADKKDTIAWNTCKAYDLHIDKHLIPFFGQRILLTEITAWQVQRFISHMKKKGFSPKTIRCAYGVLSKALYDAVRYDLIDKNPAERSELPRASHREVKPWGEKDFAAFAAASKEYRYGDILLFIILTGLREAECLGLCFDCVDFDSSKIEVRRQLQEHQGVLVRVDEMKTEHARRTLVVPPHAMEIISNRRDQQQVWKARAGDRWLGWKTPQERKTAWVFTTEEGKPVRSFNLYMTVKRIGRRIGKPELTVHDLRHVYASICLTNGTDLKTVSESLGHSSIAVTADIYTSVSDKLKAENAQRMERFLQSAL